MSSKYVDNISILQVIGCVYNDLSILEDTDKYSIDEEDFPDNFHKIIFGSIYKLYELGAKKITLENISDFLAERPKSEAVYVSQKGEEWLLKAAESALPHAFDYYYSRMKKMTLLRAYDSVGISVSDIYDPDNILDVKKKQSQEEWLDNASLVDISRRVSDKIDKIEEECIDDIHGDSYQASEGMFELIQQLKERPEVGVPMYGPFVNTVTRGARLKKFYLRSAPTGVGKSRMMIADACYIGTNRIYDEMFGWIKNGTAEPTLYITTEQTLDEVQTMMLAFLSAVPEDHILDGRYEGDEEERVLEAIKVFSEGQIRIEVLPDFSLQDIEDIIKKNIRDHGVKFVFNPKRVWDSEILFRFINGVCLKAG